MGYDSGFISGVNEPDTHYSCRIREEAERERAEAAEHKLARLTVCPEEENGRHRWDETGQCWCCEQRAHILIYEATGEGK